jgi:hypothetical protein
MTVMLRRLWIQMTADRKKFGALCVAFAIGLLLWARLIVVSQPPRTAMANDPGKVVAKPPVGPGDPVVGPGANRAVRPIELVTTPSHDPFVISPRYFPKPTQITETSKEPSKLRPQPAEEPDQIEARQLAKLQANAERFRLEAAMGGMMAVISGKTYRVGDLIPGTQDELVVFTLVEIRQRSVILEAEGYRFELQMALPGS